MEGQAITVAYGAVNYKNASATYTVLKVGSPFVRTQAANAGAKVGAMESVPAGTHQMNKGLSRVQVRHPNGTVLLVQMSRRRNGLPHSEGGLFFRLRADAPLYSVMAAVPPAPENIIGGTIQLFQGYADFLSPEELRYIGIEVDRGYLSRYNSPDELRECFTVTEMSPQRAEPPRVEEVYSGGRVVLAEVEQAPQRRMRIRR